MYTLYFLTEKVTSKKVKNQFVFRLNFKANAFEHGLNGLDALKDKDAEGVVRKRALAPDKTN